MEVARSAGTKDYAPGLIPFVTSTELNNGVVTYVEPFDTDKVFEGPAIAVSGLGFASVQLSEFLPKGNGGDSITVLTPKKPMTNLDLISCAAAFNVLHGWRFSFGRKCSIGRLKPLEIPFPALPLRDSVEADVMVLGTMTKAFVDRILASEQPKMVEESPSA
jgi:hypothetical protein